MTIQLPQEFSRGLPGPSTKLFGRDADIRAASGMLLESRTRLLTLTGTGGVGKTRLAMAVAGSVQDQFAGGVKVVELSALQNPQLVIGAIANAFDMSEITVAATPRSIADGLTNLETLLVLDNFEHLLDAARPVAELLELAPGLKVLATSRAPLRIRAEQIYHVAPLAFPSDFDNLDRSEMDEWAALQLFAERARAADPDFRWSDDIVPEIARICSELDGLPLAIELAAARSRLLSPSQMADRLVARLPLLTAGQRDFPERQQTLRKTIAWSYDLLSTEQQTVFRRLAVFNSWCSLDAAQLVVGLNEVDILNVLGDLIDHNLVVREEPIFGNAAFRMLVTIREFAMEVLVQTGELDETRTKHMSWCLEFVERENAGFRSLPSRPAGAILADFQSACDWANRLGDRETNLRLLVGMLVETPAYASISELRRQLDQAIEQCQTVSSKLQSRALWCAGHLDNLQVEVDQALRKLTLSAAIAREFGHDEELAHALTHLAQIAQEQGDFETAKRQLNEALEIANLKDRRQTGLILLFLSLVYSSTGQHDQAIEQAECALRHLESTNPSRSIHGHTLNALAVALSGAGHTERALTAYSEAIQIDTRDAWVIGLVTAGLTGVAQNCGSSERAAHIGGFVEAVTDRLGVPALMPERGILNRAMADSRTVLGDRAFERSYNAGMQLSLDHGVEYALETIELIQKRLEAPALTEPDGNYGLTTREIQVLGLVALGRRNREIGETLFISTRTVDNHVSNILHKLDLRSRADLARFATDHGLLEPHDTVTGE